MLISRRAPTIPLADAGAFERETRRTTCFRVALAVLIGALGVAAFLLARDLGRSQTATSAERSSGVLVLDLSGSVGPSRYGQIQRTLGRLTAHKERLGVVIFSDSAYEVVPPGTPPVELGLIARFFKPHAVPSTPTPFPERLIENPRFYDNPWSSSYHGGTQVSTGLDLAQRILDRDGIKHGRVILVSDLNESALDQDKLTQTLLRYGQLGIKLEIVDLSGSRGGLNYYSRLTGRPTSLTVAPSTRISSSRPSPYWLVTIAVALTLLLAGNEYFCRRLSWRHRLEAAA